VERESPPRGGRGGEEESWRGGTPGEEFPPGASIELSVRTVVLIMGSLCRGTRGPRSRTKKNLHSFHYPASQTPLGGRSGSGEPGRGEGRRVLGEGCRGFPPPGAPHFITGPVILINGRDCVRRKKRDAYNLPLIYGIPRLFRTTLSEGDGKLGRGTGTGEGAPGCSFTRVYLSGCWSRFQCGFTGDPEGHVCESVRAVVIPKVTPRDRAPHSTAMGVVTKHAKPAKNPTAKTRFSRRIGTTNLPCERIRGM